MHCSNNTRWRIKMVASLLLGVASLEGHAVPNYARQTGEPCSSCHTVAPELTAFGRNFKLNGFVLTKQPQITAKDGIPVSLSSLPALGLELDVADTFTKTNQPGTQNGDVQMPSKLKVFFAGGLSPNVGAFSYVEYTQPDDHFSFDLTDIRAVDHGLLGGKDITYGLTLNNAVTLEDPWNTLNVWSFPHVHSDVAPSPAASTLLGGVIADSGKVAGLGGYALWNNSWYADVSVYRASTTGGAQPRPTAGAVSGVAPYGRLAWQTSFSPDYLELGVSTVAANFNQGVAGTGAAGLKDRYRDYSADAQFEHPIGNNQLTLHTAYIFERQTLDASSAAGLSNPNDILKTARADGSFIVHSGNSGYAMSLAYFNTKGSTDTLMYQPAAISGSANGKPDSAGWIVQATYLPWLNMQLTIQGTFYNTFNGLRSNYDGSGRSASGNNSVFLLAMFDW